MSYFSKEGVTGGVNMHLRIVGRLRTVWTNFSFNPDNPSVVKITFNDGSENPFVWEVPRKMFEDAVMGTGFDQYKVISGYYVTANDLIIAVPPHIEEYLQEKYHHNKLECSSPKDLERFVDMIEDASPKMVSE